MLKRMDDLGLFLQGGPLTLPDLFPPLDSHCSRFDLPLLEYINHDDHKWTTCIGTPYGTNKWQAGDSPEQNGNFNMEIGKGKMELLQKKVKAGHKFQLTKTDIMWLLCYAWTKSVGRSATSKKATCERGWNPLKRACLDDDEIQKAHTRVDGRSESAYRKVQQTGSKPTSLGYLNTPIGISDETFCKFLLQEATKQREEATHPLTIQQRRR
jgi:hypothetical protein